MGVFSNSAIAVIIIAGGFYGVANAQESPTAITIANEGAYAPWNFTRPDGALDGFEIELAADLCTRMKTQCTMVSQDWDGIISSLQIRKYDAILSSLTITAERQKILSFTRPYALSTNRFAIAESDPLATAKLPERIDFADEESALKAYEEVKQLLKGKTVGVQRGGIHSIFLHNYDDGTFEIRDYATVEQYDLDFAAGRLDAIFGSAVSLAETLKKPDFKGNTLAGPELYGGILGPGFGVGVRMEDTALRDKFDEAIAAAIADGTVKKLSEKWMQTDVTPR